MAPFICHKMIKLAFLSSTMKSWQFLSGTIKTDLTIFFCSKTDKTCVFLSSTIKSWQFWSVTFKKNWQFWPATMKIKLAILIGIKDKSDIFHLLQYSQSWQSWSVTLKNQKSPTQGKRTPFHHPNPLQPWPFAYAKYAIDVPYFNLLYRSLYGFNYYKSIKKWSENASSKVYKSKIFLSRERGYPFLLNPIPYSLGPLSCLL